jgi:hypothetical protein
MSLPLFLSFFLRQPHPPPIINIIRLSTRDRRLRAGAYPLLWEPTDIRQKREDPTFAEKSRSSGKPIWSLKRLGTVRFECRSFREAVRVFRHTFESWTTRIWYHKYHAHGRLTHSNCFLGSMATFPSQITRYCPSNPCHTACIKRKTGRMTGETLRKASATEVLGHNSSVINRQRVSVS